MTPKAEELLYKKCANGPCWVCPNVVNAAERAVRARENAALGKQWCEHNEGVEVHGTASLLQAGVEANLARAEGIEDALGALVAACATGGPEECYYRSLPAEEQWAIDAKLYGE